MRTDLPRDDHRRRRSPFVFLFSGMLAVAAVVLAFVPALRHAWTFAASRRTWVLLIGMILVSAVGAVLLVGAGASDPAYFLPIAAVTVGLRLSSPFLLYRRLRDRFDPTKWWKGLRWFLAFSFTGFVAVLVYHLVRLSSGLQQVDVAILSEQLAMALGASVLIVRASLRVRPREAISAWPFWASAVLLALAFVVVLPYAVPAFEIVYAVSGLIGWSLGLLVIIRDR
jgi:hypothetical protein